MSQGKRLVNRIVFTAFIGSMLSVPFILPGPNGKPVLTADDFVPEVPDFKGYTYTLTSKFNQFLESAEDQFTQSPNELEGKQPISVFRWQDSEGNWHFSDQAPSLGNQPVAVMTVDSRGIPSLPPLPEKPVEQQGKVETKNQLPDLGQINHPFELLSQYPELIEQAKITRDQMNQRLQQQQEILNNL
ncbi:DUF4124 domain-containing protein [Parendozoicomonas sp. Alg238-R29]|uniref:DUF4124 domain-containing protein n=1 Tax=Parendozoicomonas sp. Alg238-R29 TaxID=2993446 RepID=UPI00248D9749|nr:DUF4124 domain-containing protein [Parendozoicomonas sp. Alg238-R29]